MVKFKMEDFEFTPLTEEYRNLILQGRAAEIRANLGIFEAAQFIYRQSEIPSELEGKYLLFADTLIVHSQEYRDQSALCVHYNVAGWCGHIYCNALYWPEALLVRRRKNV